MQAWQQVKVISDNSEHKDRAGYVVRSEAGANSAVIVTVNLDAQQPADGPAVPALLATFDPAELRTL